MRIGLLCALLVPGFCAPAATALAAAPGSRAGAEDANAPLAVQDPNASTADDDAGTGPPAEGDPNASRLAGVAPAAHDAAAGPIEPLDLVEEFVRFSTAAGEDQELDEAAFGASRRRHNPFARPFDRWANLLLFDHNGNGKVSWPEAVRYRRELRRAVLAAYDADQDGQLVGEERAAALKALGEGMVPALAPPTDKDRAEPGGDDPPASQPAEE